MKQILEIMKKLFSGFITVNVFVINGDNNAIRKDDWD